MAKPTLEEAMSLLAHRILALGGHHLSETCFSSLTSLLLYVCNMGKSQEHIRNRVKNLFKDTVRRHVRAATPPSTDLVILPKPESLKADHPDFYSSVSAMRARSQAGST